jgi:signal transduction histidine kinase
MATESSDRGATGPSQRFESRRYRAVVELAALDKSDFHAVLPRILMTDALELDVERVNCWKLEDRGIRCVAGYIRDTDRFESGALIEVASCPSYFRALADDPIILADDARTDVRTREFTDSYLVPLGITSMMDVPIWVRGRLWGVVCHEHIGPARQWSDAERDFAISIGHIMSMAVEASERADAERTVRFSEFFMGVLSHDLRGPLSGIRTAADVLLAQAPSGAEGVTQRIVRNADLMARMIEELLDFTRIRVGGGMPMQRGECDLAEIARHVTADLPADVAKRIDLVVHGDPVGLYDADRMRQAISNLVANSLEHGAAHCRVGVTIDGTALHDVTLTVTNRGAIPPELLPFIFDPFRRRKATPRDHKQGLGLGLFIVREIVAAHEGSVGVAAPHGNVAFTARLPRRSPRS